jgi:hypothetical protein
MGARLVLAALLILGLPVVAHAVTLSGTCVNTEGNAACTKTLVSTATTLSITLTNTSGSGFLTADAFNIPTNGEVFTLVPSPTGAFSFTTGSISTVPFGTRNALLSTDGNWEGGAPTGGIAAGASLTFNFTVAGGGGLSDAEATALFNSEVLRFQGFTNGGSDKATITTTPTGVPEPSTLLLLGFGVVGMGFVARRKRSRQQ